MLGYCHEDFSEVKRIFNHNFDKYKEIGSSLCVIVDGEIVVDIWAGHKNKDRTEDWNEDTLSIAFSSKSFIFSKCIVMKNNILELKNHL